MQARHSAVLVLVVAACGGNIGDTETSQHGDEGGGRPGGTTVTSSSGSMSASTGPSSGAGGSTAGKAAMFVAQGDVGRTMISCDDGHTWVGNRSWDIEGDAMVCGSTAPAHCYDATCSYSVGGQCQEETCCGDTPDRARGVGYGDGKFVATWGWGQPGSMRTSTNGVDWTETHPDDSFGGVAFGGGRFVAASRSPFWSSDGDAWTAGATADFRNADGSTMWSVRRFAFADLDAGGVFVAVASGDTSMDMLLSTDATSWWRPSVIPPDCGNDVMVYGGIVAGNGVIVIVGMDGNACRSTDGGQTWSVTPTGVAQVLSHGVWTGTEFAFWGDDAFMIHSPDGATWTKTAMATPLRLGPVARSDQGTLVALGNVWDAYEKQQLYRSTDGLTWEALPASAFTQSHPIFAITFGYADKSTTCPD